MGSVEVDLNEGARYIESNLELLQDPYEIYLNATDEVRRRLNQAIFSRIYISDEQATAVRYNEPLGHLMAAQSAY